MAISVMAKLISIMLLLVAVHARDFFPSDHSSLLSESEFLHDSDDESSVPLRTPEFPLQTESHAEETSMPSANELPLDFEETNFPPVTHHNQFPLETQSHPDQNSVSSKSEFPEDSKDTHLPLETPQVSMETDSHSKRRSPPQTSPPSPSETPSSPEAPSPKTSPSSLRGSSTSKACKAKCATKCMRKRVPVIHNLCSKICRRRCILHYAQVIYNCTIQCAESMPKKFKSDPKKTAGYVDHCYQKCVKKL